MHRNTKPHSRIVIHEALLPANDVLLPEAATMYGGSQPTPTDDRPSYDLEWVFKRGTLINALNVEMDKQAEQVIDAYIANSLPPTSFDQGAGILSPFWLDLALRNGHPIFTLWRNYQRQHAIEAVKLAERDGWLFTLPFWPLPDMSDREPLIFFGDTGLHARLIVRWVGEERQKAIEQEKKDPDRARAMRRTIDHSVRSIDDLRFQGFATFALMRAVPDARPYVLDRPTVGEIDLVLDGPNKERWAVEITNGDPSRKPTNPRVFHRFCEELGISQHRRRVVYREVTAKTRHAKAGVVALTLPMLLAELTGR